MPGSHMGCPDFKTIFVWRALYREYRRCLVEVIDERDGPKWEINPMEATPLGIRLRNQVQERKGNSQADALSRLLTEGETVDAIDDEIPCFITEPTDATEDEEEEFGRVDDILALEGRPPLIASITSKPSLRRSSFASKPSTPSVVESRRRWTLEK